LALLKELESDRLARTKTAIRIKKEEEGKGISTNLADQPAEGVIQASENLRTVEFEAIQHLSAPFHASLRQNEASIARLVKDLAPYGLTKAEKLQIVNLAPTDLVELYVIVEELEDRLSDEKTQEILTLVRRSLSDRPSGTPSGPGTNFNIQTPNGTLGGANGPADGASASASASAPATGAGAEVCEEDADADGDAETWYDDAYDDTGAGAGVEGDLEMDDD